jgi:hypothetical protein
MASMLGSARRDGIMPSRDKSQWSKSAMCSMVKSAGWRAPIAFGSCA